MGRISEERFDTLLAVYEKEQAELRPVVQEGEAALEAFEQDTARADSFLELARKFTDFSELTTPMLNEFIDKILVHAPDRSEGDRVQEVEIYLKYIGRFEAPMPEPTEEELREQERLREKRARSRELYRRKKAGENVSPPYERVCRRCGKTFTAMSKRALYCGLSCRDKYYKETRKAKAEPECRDAFISS